MIDARASRNGEDASDLVTALLSNVGALHNQAWLLSCDAGYIVANRVGRLAKTVVSLLSNRIDAVFQAVIIRPWEGHGPSRSCPFRFEQAAH